MLSLREYLEQEGIGGSEFARRLSRRLNRRVPPQSVHRWAVEQSHPNYAVPRSAMVTAIQEETAGQVEPNDWFPNGEKPRRKARDAAINSAASRRGWIARRRRESHL